MYRKVPVPDSNWLRLIGSSAISRKAMFNSEAGWLHRVWWKPAYEAPWGGSVQDRTRSSKPRSLILVRFKYSQVSEAKYILWRDNPIRMWNEKIIQYEIMSIRFEYKGTSSRAVHVTKCDMDNVTVVWLCTPWSNERASMHDWRRAKKRDFDSRICEFECVSKGPIGNRDIPCSSIRTRETPELIFTVSIYITFSAV